MAKPGGSSNMRSECSLPGMYAGTRVPLRNLDMVSKRMDSLQSFLAESVNSNTVIGKDQMVAVSSEIADAIHQVIVNGAALLSCSQQYPLQLQQPPAAQPGADPIHALRDRNPCEKRGEEDLDDCDVVELDAVELLAEHVHFCEICGKGFKRDANLRMHMRAHGDQYKTPEALSKPQQQSGGVSHDLTAGNRKTRFSCPYEGCNRNRRHKRFRPLKSVICLRNHFRRSHCPKLYACHRCQKKSFSVLADLKSHVKHCGEAAVTATTSAPRWRCSCGTSFTRKDKLFGHVANFEGHMPAVAACSAAMEEDEAEEGEDTTESEMVKADEATGSGCSEDGFFQGLLDGFHAVDNFCLHDILGSPVGFS